MQRLVTPCTQCDISIYMLKVVFIAYMKILLLSRTHIVYCHPHTEHLETYCKELFEKELNKLYLPPMNEEYPGQPLNVYVKFKIIDIDEINEASMDFRLHVYFKMMWNDTRLNETATGCNNFVWTPDVIFERAKGTQKFQSTSTVFLVNQNGTVIMTHRYSFKVNCRMVFHMYPFDTQHCYFTVAFIGTPDSVATLRWFGDPRGPFREDVKPVETIRKIELLQYHLGEISTSESTAQFSYANHTYLVASIPLVRNLVGSILCLYMPSTLIVVVSWVTFWLRPDTPPARVALSITSLLTLCTQVHQYKMGLPALSYVTAMDVWFFVCIFMVFATIVEFAIAYNAFIERKEQQEERNKVEKIASDESKDNAWLTGEEESRQELTKSSPRQKAVRMLLRCKNLKYWTKTDEKCRIIFPVIFLTFFFFYWTCFLSL